MCKEHGFAHFSGATEGFVEGFEAGDAADEEFAFLGEKNADQNDGRKNYTENEVVGFKFG